MDSAHREVSSCALARSSFKLKRCGVVNKYLLAAKSGVKFSF